MVRRVLVIGLVAFAGLVLPDGALAASPGGACSGPSSVSALSQYCEDLPAATGGNTPAPGTPAVQLPAGTVQRIDATPPRSAERKLLRLPGAAPHHALRLSGTALTTSSSTPWLLILVLLAVATALVAAVAARRRRQHRGP